MDRMTGQDIKEPRSLKELLEFLSMLMDNHEVRKKVMEEIKDRVKDYIPNKLTDFADEDASRGYLFEAIKESNDLRTKLVARPDDYDYKHYNTQFQGEDYANKYAKHLIDNIFPLFGCLYYMYFECSDDGSTIGGGGEWKSEKCDVTRSGKDHLKKWLTDETGQNVKSRDSSSILMIKRDFKQGELSTNEGRTLFPSFSSTDALLHYLRGAQLQFALYYMLFLPDDENWNNAQLGHAVLFLKAFCEKVHDGEFNGQYTEAEDSNFKNACEGVRDNIETLTELKIIVPVAWYQTGKYKDLLDWKHFWKYIRWLIKNLSRLMTSLSLMKDDVSKWDKESLKTSTTFGPYPWGFTFAYNGEKKTGQLNGPLNNLISSLKTVNDALENIKPIPPSSTASTVGGVAAGLGAAGAAGAAAYSGLLGPVAEGIGRFFKGLFI